ncbi:cupin domain-containing protein [Roseibium sp.]|uniref:cupin domain-containing protein n=1 Tax=Roseibium sp. TaxID=1936156 RepID=UPI003D0D7882
MTKTARNLFLSAGILSVLNFAMPVLSQEEKPTKAVGISVPRTNTLELGGQFPELEGYRLQIRTIVLQPGAHSFYHNHAKRPVVAYLVSGDYTEHRDGEGTVAHAPGEQWVEDKDVAHWSENRGQETAYLVNVEVLRPKKK